MSCFIKKFKISNENIQQLVLTFSGRMNQITSRLFNIKVVIAYSESFFSPHNGKNICREGIHFENFKLAT